MQIFGMHWLGHLVYLAALAGLGFWGSMHLSETAWLGNELARMQELTLPEMEYIERSSMYDLREMNYSSDVPQQRLDTNIRQMKVWTDHFHQKSAAIGQRLVTGTPCREIDWTTGLLDDYYRLGDSLSGLYGLDSASKYVLDRCLYAGYLTFPREELAAILANADTVVAGRICRNLQWRVRLAVIFLQDEWLKQVQDTQLHYNAFIPVFSCENFARAGVPFEADIFLISYTLSSQILEARVNGEPVPMEAGLAHYNAVFKHPGTHTFPVEITVRNPLTGETGHFRKDYKAEVTEGFGQ